MISNDQTILFIGDSITDCGRRSTEQPLGNGYVKLFRDLMIVRRPDCHVRILNKGIGGDRVTQLRDRWADDVLRHKPDWLSIKIGINDLIIRLADAEDSLSPQMYEEVYDGLLARTRDALPDCQLLLIDPFLPQHRTRIGYPVARACAACPARLSRRGGETECSL
jgi:lysophospholipase L1-like esterase